MRSALRLGFLACLLPLAGNAAFAGKDFRYDIAPILAKEGCAAAECHGGATGRGGFKLSLFATNALADYEAITADLFGRRVDFDAPSESLLLRKPSRDLKHGGGRVIERDGDSYQALLEWIAGGAPFSSGESEPLSGLDLALDGGQAKVTARFGPAARDVTRLSRFESTNPAVAKVDAAGRLTTTGKGETWIVARYGHLAARLPVVESFTNIAATREEEAHPLDEAWRRRLDTLGVAPAPPEDRNILFRRLSLDLLGRPPTPDETAGFEALPEGEGMAEFARRFLASEEFSGVLAGNLWQWFEVPFPDTGLGHTRDRDGQLRQALADFAASDKPVTEWIEECLSGRNSDLLERFRDPRERAEFAGRAFLGISIGCARCHNHPLDKWSQADHLQFSAFFTGAGGGAGDGDGDGRRDGSGARMTPGSGEFFLPGDGTPVEPRLLAMGRVEKVTLSPGESRTAALRRFFLEGNHEALARNVANRIFGILSGRPLVDGVDDHRLTNPAIHEPVLETLTRHLIEHDFRLRPLVEWIVTSKLYARSSAPPDSETLTGDPGWRYLARGEARALSPRQFQRAVEGVLGVPLPEVEALPATPLAGQLHLLNSGSLQKALNTPGNQVEAIFDFETDPAARLEQLFLLILSRRPTEAEQAEFSPLFASEGGSDPAKAIAAGRDLAFALFASREFGSIR